MTNYEAKTELCHTLIETILEGAVQKSERLKRSKELMKLARKQHSQKIVAEICHTLVETALGRTVEKPTIEMYHTRTLDPIKRPREEEDHEEPNQQKRRKKLYTVPADFNKSKLNFYSTPNATSTQIKCKENSENRKAKFFPIFERQVSTSKPSTQPKLSPVGGTKLRRKLKPRKKLPSHKMVGTEGPGSIGKRGCSSKFSQGNTATKQSSILAYYTGDGGKFLVK